MTLGEVFAEKIKKKEGIPMAAKFKIKGKDSCLNGIASIGKNAPEAEIEEEKE